MAALLHKNVGCTSLVRTSVWYAYVIATHLCILCNRTRYEQIEVYPTEVLKTIYDANGTIDANNKQSLTASIQKIAGIAV